MRAASRTSHHWLRMTGRCVTRRRRSADVLGVYDTVTEAETAAEALAARGIMAGRISLVQPLTNAGAGRERPGPDAVRAIVLLHGHLSDTERAQEILADLAARAHEGRLPVD